MIRRFEQFIYSITDITRSWHKIAACELEKFGLKAAHAVYLTALYRHPEGVTAPQLVELCGKDKADVSRMMTSLEAKGFVEKKSVHQNRYGGSFLLTPSGIQAAEYACNRASIAVGLAGGDLSDQEREIFYKALESISANLRLYSESGLPLKE